jgi:hypothetical protein
MGPEAILLSVLEGGREGTYRFTCPTCMDDVEKRADRKIVALLVSAGVDVSTGRSLPDLQPEFENFIPSPEEIPEGPPITADDLIEFHFLLQDDRYIQDFLAKQ